jgi:hypothetical protein
MQSELLSVIFLFFLERAEASSGLSFFVTFLDKQKSLKENNIRFLVPVPILSVGITYTLSIPQ